MNTKPESWQRFLLSVTDALSAGRDGVHPTGHGAGDRVGRLALTLARAAASAGVPGADELRDQDRTALRLAAGLHAFVEEETAGTPPSTLRLGADALAAIEYRLRWIREVCRHRAIARSVFDGGGFYPPADPSGLNAMDYALRATDVESVLEFVTRMNRTGPETDKDREWLGELARRHLETGEGPSVPYLTEDEHDALCRSSRERRDPRRADRRTRLETFLDRLAGVAWPEELDTVPDLVESLVRGAGRGSTLTARLLVVAARCDRLLHRGGPRHEGLPPAQVLMQLRHEAEEGRLDRDLVAALDEKDLMPADEAPAPLAAGTGGRLPEGPVGVH